MTIWQLLALAIGLNVAGFVIAYAKKSDKLTDFSYGLTFFLIALFAFLAGNRGTASKLIFFMVAAWSARIGIFLLYRVVKNKKDKRFDGIRESFLKFFRFWFLQGLTAWIVLLPAMFVLIDSPGAMSGIAWLGLAIAAIGLVIETVADFQKFGFNNEPKNKGRFISTGLWKYSRHPNYFGEMSVWTGLYLAAFPFMTTTQRLYGLASPLWIYIVLLFLTGIPKLEKYADEKWGKEAAYQQYKRRTSVLLLLPKRRDSAHK